MPLFESSGETISPEIGKLRKEVVSYLEDLKGSYEIFRLMVDGVSPTPNKSGDTVRKKITFDALEVWVTKADENGIEGEIAGTIGSAYYRKWTDMPPRVIYDLLPENTPGKAEGYKAIFCYTHNLNADGEQALILYYQHNPSDKAWIDEVLVRYQPEYGGSVPPGGFIVYQRQWVTSEAKEYLEKGYVRYNNTWMSYDQVMKDKGFIRFQERWVTAVEKERLETQLKQLEKLRAELVPKGVINRPGADTETNPWAKARFKETPHYRIRTNLSAEALNDISYVMETLYYEYKKIFKVDMPYKLEVWVCRNQKEYFANGGPKGSGGIFMGDKIVTYYQPYQWHNTTSVLLHEGSHQFLMLGAGILPPSWINEGFATYYESSIFDGAALVTNQINKISCYVIQMALKSKQQMKLSEFLNAPVGRGKYLSNLAYSQAWSLTYFCFNWRGGYYADELEEYLNYFKKPVSLSDKQHIELFERIFKVKLDVLEEQWKDYTLGLKIQ